MEQQSPKKRFEAKALFAACNSASGFQSFFEDIFYREGIRRVYLIRGGPGTGKGTFMRRVGEAAEQRGAEVAYYYCSSDPNSLDAVVIDGRTVLVDSTAPHVMEPILPGARDEIVDLGAFWDSERLLAAREQIDALGGKKDACYRRAYRYLAGCGELAKVNRELILPFVDLAKMRRAAKRLLEKMPCGDGFCDTPALCHAVSMQGDVRRYTFEENAQTLYSVLDCYGTAYLFLEAVAQEAMRKEIPILTARNPILPEVIEGIYFCHCHTAFVSVAPKAERDGEVVNMRRFLTSRSLGEVRGEYRRNMQLHEALLGAACDALREAGEVHFALEQIYGNAMDFDALDRFAKTFIQKLWK